MKDDSLLWILAGGVLIWWLNQQGYLAEFFNPAVSSTATDLLPAATAAPATVSIAGPVTLNQSSDSLSASVSINGTVQPITLGISNGVAQDSYGDNITTTLQAQGVNIPSLLSMMQASYSASPTTTSSSAGTSGLGRISRIDAHFIHRAMR